MPGVYEASRFILAGLLPGFATVCGFYVALLIGEYILESWE